MNPDGYEHTIGSVHFPTRKNGNNVDLNRGFPTWKDLGQDRAQLKEGRQKEVKVMIDWIMDNPFVLSINFHGGEVVVNYPWDMSEVQPWTKSSLFREHREGDRGQYTADNKEFQELSLVYSTNHKTMSQVFFPHCHHSVKTVKCPSYSSMETGDIFSELRFSTISDPFTLIPSESQESKRCHYDKAPFINGITNGVDW